MSLSLLLVVSLVGNSCATPKETTLKAPKDLRDKMVYIPEGIAIIDSDTTSVHSFWMSKYELTNREYLEFLVDLKSKGLVAEFNTALPDTVQWRKATKYGDPNSRKSIVKHYLRHPAFQNYPVVNISHESAKMYCQWLTEKYHSDSGNGMRYVFRLPTHFEWLNAAQAGENRPYSWNSFCLRDEKGQFRANFKNIPNELLTIDEETQQLSIAKNTQRCVSKTFETNEKGEIGTRVTISKTVDSYSPGLSGIYNLNGNVAEMIAVKGIAVGGSWNCLGNNIQNTSVLKYEEPSPFVGLWVIMTVEKVSN